MQLPFVDPASFVKKWPALPEFGDTLYGTANIPRSPQIYGAKLDLVTDDAPAFTLWLNYLYSIHGGLGTKVHVKIPGSRRFRFATQVTIDISRVYIDWNNARVTVANSLTSAGTDAIIITTTNGNEQNKVAQVHGGMERLYLYQESSLKTAGHGAGLSFVNDGIGLSHVTLEKIIVTGFGEGAKIASSNNYLFTFHDCALNSNDIGLQQIQAANSGENMTYNGGIIAGNNLGLDLTENAMDWKFNDTSFDFNLRIAVLNSGCVEFKACHFENASPSVTQITASGARCHVRFFGGEFWCNGTATTDYWIETIGTSASVRGWGVEFFNTRTPSHRFALGNVDFYDSVTHNNTNNCRILNETKSLIRGTFESTIPLGIMVTGAAPVSNRLSFGNGTSTGCDLARSTTVARTGTNSLRYRKFSAAGATDGNIRMFIPLAARGRPFTWEAWVYSPVTAPAFTFSQYWCEAGPNEFGILVNNDALLLGTSGNITANTTWQAIGTSGTGYRSESHTPPPWAEYFLITYNFNALGNGNVLYFDDLVASGW